MDLEHRKRSWRGQGSGVACFVTFALLCCLGFAFTTQVMLSKGNVPIEAFYATGERPTSRELVANAPHMHALATLALGGHSVSGSWWQDDTTGLENSQEETLVALAHDFEVSKEALPAISDLPSTLGFTFAAWLRMQHVASGDRCVATHGGPEGRWTLSIAPSGSLTLTVRTVSSITLKFSTVLALGLDSWTHVAVGYDGEKQTAAFYFDGRVVPHAAPRQDAVGDSAALPLLESSFAIGRCEVGAQWADGQLFTGSVAGVQVWDRLVAPEQALWLWSRPDDRPSTDPTESSNSEQAGLVFAAEAVPELAKLLKQTHISAHSEESDPGALYSRRLSAFATCAMPSPAEVALHGVEKPGSLTVMTWVKMASLPEKKEACILSHGSWERGWKLSIIPYLNIQFSVRTSSGETLDFFSAPITPSLRWQHLAVTYNAEDASVAFFANGFPLDMDFQPEVKAGRAHSIVPEAAPFTIGRCTPDDDQDELMVGEVTDVMMWEGVLDFQAIRSVAYGAAATPGAVRRLQRSLPDRKLAFALPASGCIGRAGPLPSLPPEMAPPQPRPYGPRQREAMQAILLQTAVVVTCTGDAAPALRVLDALDNQASALLAGGQFGTVRAIVLVLPGNESNTTTPETLDFESRYQRLDVEILRAKEESAVHAVVNVVHELRRHKSEVETKHSEGPQKTSSSSTTTTTTTTGRSLKTSDTQIEWVLMLNDHLKPLEHWLHNLLATALPPSHGKGRKSLLGRRLDFNASSPPLAVKSLTLTAGGMVKSSGMRHYLTVLGDGDVIPAPYMVQRGYKASYVRRMSSERLAAEAEAATCESLLISAPALLSGSLEVPEDMARLYQCAVLTAPLAARGELAMAVGSWVLELQPADVAARWDAGGDSMLRMHEEHKESVLKYSQLRGDVAMKSINAGMELDLRVRWFFACGGSWAWEAANLVEHLERRVPIRIQMQSPFQYCGGHNVLSAAALSFGERMERMVELPSLALEPAPSLNAAQSSQGGINAANTKGLLQYKPFRRGTSFLQDDVAIYHRDWFRASNWQNMWIERPGYLIGRYMNEVSGVHARVVQQCNELDEVWVPSKHHIEVFAKAGVQRSKLVVIPESIDPGIFDPSTIEPMMLPGRKKYVFLSIFKFEERKNWRQLVWAYSKAFTAKDDVTLYIHTNLKGKFDKMDLIKETIWEFITSDVLDGSTQHTDASTIPHWELTGKPLSTEAMIGLYKAGDAYVLPTHGEGWGLPYAEAMTMGLPTIATDWGGNLEFMTPENSLLVRVKGFEDSDAYDDWIRNFHWATPDAAHLAELMAWVYYNPSEAKAMGRRARADMIQKFSNEAVAEVIMARLRVIKGKLEERKKAREAAGGAGALAPQPLSSAFQWTIASDVKLCSNMPSVSAARRNKGTTVPLVNPHTIPHMPKMHETTNTKDTAPSDSQIITMGGRAPDPHDPVGAPGSQQQQQQQSDESTAHTQPPNEATTGNRKLHSIGRGAHCPATPTKVAFITPYRPRADGLAYHAVNMRAAMMEACPTLTIDIFAIVMDFFSAYSEPYNSTVVRNVIFRESWVDYASAASTINSEYDAALLNFKLGTLGGSSSAYAVCMVKSIAVPTVTIVHSVHLNMDDALQYNLLHVLVESEAAVVMSNRAALGLDVAAGFIPSIASALQADGVVVVPHGAPALPPPTMKRKEWAKENLGMSGKRVIVTAGLMGPDKGAQHVLPAIDKLAPSLRAGLLYVIAGQPADCGATCIDFYNELTTSISELNLGSHVVLIPQELSASGWLDLWQAADIAVQLYPEDLIPHPSTFMEALTHGAVPVVTPFSAARAAASEKSAVLVWERDPIHVAAALTQVLSLSPEQLTEMQRAGWEAAQGSIWSKVGEDVVASALMPALLKGV